MPKGACEEQVPDLFLTNGAFQIVESTLCVEKHEENHVIWAATSLEMFYNSLF